MAELVLEGLGSLHIRTENIPPQEAVCKVSSFPLLFELPSAHLELSFKFLALGVIRS